MKRIIHFNDIIISLIACILLIPLTIFIIVIRKIYNEKGKIFYTQYRIGKNGKMFRMIKFRTMVADADKVLKLYLDHDLAMRQEYNTYKKLKNDPRITRVGRILRKFSIDEFPQFINVLKGDMSIVGPRPYLPKEKKDMGNLGERIIQVKPGLTGIWQIQKKRLTFQKRVELEATYYSNGINIIDYYRFILKTVVMTCSYENDIKVTVKSNVKIYN